MGVLPGDELAGYTALGELSLDARVSPVAGVLPAAVHALCMERGLICPAAEGGEAAWAEGFAILVPGSLIALCSATRRAGPEVVITCRSWSSPITSKKKQKQ